MAVLDETEELVGELRVSADRWQRDRLLRFAEPFEPRTWAIAAAGGLGSRGDLAREGARLASRTE